MSITTTTTPPDLTAPAVDHGIRVTVVPAFAAEHSDPSADRFVFTYQITIANAGDDAAQLVARHWAVIDGPPHEVTSQWPLKLNGVADLSDIVEEGRYLAVG